LPKEALVYISKPFAITMGDPCGIGPEVVAKLFAHMVDRPKAFAVGDAGSLRRACEGLGLQITARQIADPKHARYAAGEIDVLQPGAAFPASVPLGRIDARAGRAAFDYVVRAIELALAGKARALVTAPINKEAMHAAGIKYPGHTEILADLGGARDVRMMLMNDELRVVLTTIHVSLRDVADLITIERELTTIRLAYDAARRLGIDRPRVAVAGLNPHAGEGGMFGREDIDKIAPAIAQARAEGIDVSGPWPGDTVFMRARAKQFDIVVAQFHDQGLIPIKYLGIDQGVNVTLGLPFVRTSPDHGTAFDIAGKGIADATSMEAALRQAVAMTSAADTSLQLGSPQVGDFAIS
jgi:4-hydroxythreonine-4-phosphate dehydrogenase